MLLFLTLVLEHIMLIVFGGISLALTIALVVVHVKYKRIQTADKDFHGEASKVGTSQEMGTSGDYHVMSRGVQYSVGYKGHVVAGRYILKNALEGGDSFNLRHNGLVNRYPNDSLIHLNDGDTLTAVSGSIMMKKV